MFWLNMEMAESTNFFGFTGFPTNVSNIKVVSPTELTNDDGQATRTRTGSSTTS